MSDTPIFAIGIFVTLLCVAFVVITAMELKHLGRESERKAAAKERR